MIIDSTKECLYCEWAIKIDGENKICNLPGCMKNYESLRQVQKEKDMQETENH